MVANDVAIVVVVVIVAVDVIDGVVVDPVDGLIDDFSIDNATGSEDGTFFRDEAILTCWG